MYYLTFHLTDALKKGLLPNLKTIVSVPDREGY